jgi:menaquinone-dependent protoporphyrinogen oxidase
MSGVLVAFATKNGSTQAVAEAVAASLRDKGIAVDLQPVRAVRSSIEHYDLVVLGAPLYSGRWHRDARRFLKRHRAQLPITAIFGMGPRQDTPEAWTRSRAQLDRVLARYAWLAPARVALFGGVDPPGKRTGRDLRDWGAVAAWAARLAEDPAADDSLA